MDCQKKGPQKDLFLGVSQCVDSKKIYQKLNFFFHFPTKILEKKIEVDCQKNVTPKNLF